MGFSSSFRDNIQSINIHVYKYIIIIIVIIIIKRISRAPIYHTRWQHRALHNNTHQ